MKLFKIPAFSGAGADLTSVFGLMGVSFLQPNSSNSFRVSRRPVRLPTFARRTGSARGRTLLPPAPFGVFRRRAATWVDQSLGP